MRVSLKHLSRDAAGWADILDFALISNKATGFTSHEVDYSVSPCLLNLRIHNNAFVHNNLQNNDPSQILLSNVRLKLNSFLFFPIEMLNELDA